MKKIPVYGRSPIHLMGLLVCYGLAIYAGVKLFSNVSLWVALAFPAGIFVHDFILYPLYTKADRALSAYQLRQFQEKKISVAWINYLRLPVMIAVILLLCYFPIILRLSEDRPLYTSLSQDSYLYRWLIVVAAFSVGSAFSYFLKKRTKRKESK